MEYLRDQSAVEESATLLVAWLDLLTGMASGEEGARNVFESLLTSNAGKRQPLLIFTHEPGRYFLVSITSTARCFCPFQTKDRERYYFEEKRIHAPRITWAATLGNSHCDH